MASEPALSIPAEPALGSDGAREDTTFQRESEAISQALEARQFEVAHTLLSKPAPAGAREHWRAYRMMLECLEHPGKSATAGAYRFTLEEAPREMRSDLASACLSTR
jgi:hypothetical protein